MHQLGDAIRHASDSDPTRNPEVEEKTASQYSGKEQGDGQSQNNRYPRYLIDPTQSPGQSLGKGVCRRFSLGFYVSPYAERNDYDDQYREFRSHFNEYTSEIRKA